MYTPDPKAVAALKEKHGRVFLAKSEDGQFQGLLRYPTRKDISYATAGSAASDPLKMGETLINSCWLEGDEEMRTNDAYFRGLMGTIETLVDVKQVELEEL